MPVKTPAKKSYRRRPKTVVIARKRSKAPLNKRQYSAVTKLVKKSMYKTAETKYVFKKIDYTMGISLASEVIPYDGAPLNTRNQIPMPPDGDGLNSRDGNQIQPVAWIAQGHLTIPGSSGNQDNRTCNVRLVAAFYDKDELLDMNLTNTNLFRFGNNMSAKTDDFSDTYKSFNWGLIRPFYDRTFTLQPGLGYTNDAGTTIIYQGAPQKGRDVVKFNIKHFFKKGSKLSCEGTNETDYMQNKNIVLFAMTRNVNDSYPSSNLTLKILGTTQFLYKDF